MSTDVERDKKANLYATEQRANNSLIVDGYIREIELDDNVPLELYKLCQTFCYIDTTPYIMYTDLKKVYSNIRMAYYDHNLLLAKELALYQLNINQQKTKQNLFHNLLGMIYEEQQDFCQ